MGIMTRLTRWFTVPIVEVGVVECVSCGNQVSADTGDCPECGDELPDREVIPAYGFSGPMG